jgi:RNA polymerase sigma-70 factor (ECF subfamily)
VALTLKIVGGFSVGEIARALLAQESAVAQRLVRAKRLLRDRNVEFRAPDAADLTERLDSVLDAIYLLFNEGYAATSGDTLLREDISAEAIRLARVVVHHPTTGVPRAWALLALLLLHAARFGGRVGAGGELFLLRDQDRSKWDRRLISEGLRALDHSAAGETISPYHLEAEIAGCHAVAAAWKDTDWARIVDCYDQLVAITGSPVVALNRAIARAQVDGPAAGIVEIERIREDPALRHYHLLPAALAELWQELGDHQRAAAHYREALDRSVSLPERRFLTSRLQGLRAVL